MDRDTVNVAIYFDESYAMHAATMVRSLLDNACSSTRIDLFVLDCGVTAESKVATAAGWADERLTVHWMVVDFTPYTDLFTSATYPPSAFARLLIDRLLPSEVTRVITLDCDGVVLDDIRSLWTLAPTTGCVTAALDLSVVRLRNDTSFTEQTGSWPAAPYFNSGVMVIDLDRWRELGVTERCLDLARRHPAAAIYADQSLLNVVLHGEWERLPLRWNCHAFVIAECRFPSLRDQFVDSAEVEVAARRPGFVHFVGGRKPWVAMSAHPHATLYRRYRDRATISLADPVRPTLARRVRQRWREARFPLDRYRRVRRQSLVHGLRRRRAADLVHLSLIMTLWRHRWRATWM